ncbi:MAG: YCF48-related protein [Bacteroidales bacterium]
MAFFLFSCIGIPGIAQKWSSTNLPRFRAGNDLVLLPDYKSVAVGGNESNDAITGIYRSTDTARTWILISDAPMSPWLTSVSFPNSLIGYTSGFSGLVKKTTDGGLNWTNLTLPGNTASRNYKSTFFLTTSLGFIAGGNRSMDSIQTVLRTIDAGDSWNILLDRPGSWLRSVFFTDDQHGFVTGDRGTILKTSNGGTSWDAYTLPGSTKNRQLNSVFFTGSQIGFIVGGNPSNDSIQTILKTTDGGASWNIIRDAVSPMLNDVFFLNQDTGYAVGDYGTVLKTLDGGISWNPENIPSEINDSRNLNAVHFFDRYFGAAVGQTGKLLIFTDSVPAEPPPGVKPTVVPQGMRLLSSGKVMLFATLFPNALPSTISVHYGTTAEMIQMAGGDLEYSGTEGIPVSFTLEGLDPHLSCYYQFISTSSAGTSETEVLSFYPGYDIPNWDFELWDSISKISLDEWNVGGTLSRISLGNANFAVEMHSTKDSPGAVIYGDYKNGSFIGGIPFSGKPDSLLAYVNYSLTTGDTALVLLILKKEGQFITDSIYKYAGSSSGKFERLGFKIDYFQDISPDSLIIAFTSSNFFSGTMDSTSMVMIDSIGFSGTSETVPNASLNHWTNDLHLMPKSWLPNDYRWEGNEGYTTSPVTEKYNGKYALQLSNAPSNHGYYNGMVRTSHGFDEPSPSFPVNARHHEMNCFVKFYPDGQDSLYFNINMFKTGSPIGFGFAFIDSLADKYTRVIIPIQYNGEEIPDSASIQIMLGKPEKGSFNSYALIDALTFDAISVKVKPGNQDLSTRVFPNPASDFVSIFTVADLGSRPELRLYDYTGREISVIPCTGKFNNNYTFSLSGLPDGLYFGRLHDDSNPEPLISNFKIMISH